MTEKELITGVLDGRREATRELVNTYQPLVFSVVRHFSVSEADLEDIAQEVFMEVFKSIKNFRNDSSLATWIYRIAFSRSLNHIKKLKRRSFFEKAGILSLEEGGELREKASPSYDASEIMQNHEREKILNQAVASLPDTQRIAFILSKYEGKSNQQIAEIMSTTVSAIESLHHRARLSLRKTLAVYYQQNMKS